jgi:DNA polymerase-1
LSKIRGAKSLHAKLVANREIAFLSKQLATVSREVPGVKADLKSLAYRGADAARIEAIFSRMGFNKIRERVPVQGA